MEIMGVASDVRNWIINDTEGRNTREKAKNMWDKVKYAEKERHL